jgi:hypothetical protein
LKPLTLSLLPYPIALAFAVALVITVYIRPEPDAVNRTTTWCPTPAQRAAADRSLATVQVVARLREIRTKFEALHAAELLADPDDAPGSVAELDRLLGELIADLDLDRTPLMEGQP